MKFLVGSLDVGANVSRYADALRLHGHTVDTAVLDYHTNVYSQFSYDHILSARDDTKVQISRGNDTITCKLSPSYEKFLLNYDVYIIIASNSFVSGGLDLPILRQAGKKIISVQCGSEVRCPHVADIMWSAWGTHYSKEVLLYCQKLRELHIKRGLPTSIMEVIQESAYSTCIA